MQTTVSWTGLCKDIIEKFYQLSLKLEPLEERGREYGYPSMSGGKYKEGFESKEELYEQSIDVANELFSEDVKPEEKLCIIIKEIKTLVNNGISPKVVTTFLNSCLRISGLSNKFLFYVDEVSQIKFDEKQSDENNAIVANWMNEILNNVIEK